MDLDEALADLEPAAFVEVDIQQQQQQQQHLVAAAGEGEAPAEAWPDVKLSHRAPLSLERMSAIAIIKQLHPLTVVLEDGYFDKWQSVLTKANQSSERSINIRGADTGSIVQKYNSQEDDWRRTTLQVALQHNDDLSPKKKGKGKKAAKRARMALMQRPYKLLKQAVDADSPIMIVRRVRSGIPEGIPAEDYIRYRKAKYIEDIKRLRTYLVAQLNPSSLNSLMSTLSNMAQYDTKGEFGLLTLQAVLMNNYITSFSIASVNFYKNFKRNKDEEVAKVPKCALAYEDRYDMETKMGPTVLHYTLMEGHALTHVNLEHCACDSLLKVLSSVATNLRYLNISSSVVSDKGLFHLAGLDVAHILAESVRTKLPRACKVDAAEQDKLVRNETPKWSKKGPGCSKLVHLECNRLHAIEWPKMSSTSIWSTYLEFPRVPIDCGFVAILLYCPELRVFHTEVGIRAIYGALRVHKKLAGKRRPTSGGVGSSLSRKRSYAEASSQNILAAVFTKNKLEFDIEAVSDARPTQQLMDVLAVTCPKLKLLNVAWWELTPNDPLKRESWCLTSENTLSGLKNLTHLRTSNIDFKGTDPSLGTVLSANQFGQRLTSLYFGDLVRFRYSHLKAIKECCPNLKSLAVVVMMNSRKFSIMPRISIDRDHNMQLAINEKSSLPNLKELYLSGPFGFEVAKYLLKGANGLQHLALSIEWMSSHVCDNQPRSRKDFLGPDYFEEIFNVNPLLQLEELHLMAQHKRSRGREFLTKDFAKVLLSRLPKLKHLGNFSCWNMSEGDKRSISRFLRLINRATLLEEDLTCCRSDLNEVPFAFRYVPNRSSFHCRSLELLRESGDILTELFGFHPMFQAFAGEPGIGLNALNGIDMLELDGSDEEDEGPDNFLVVNNPDDMENNEINAWEHDFVADDEDDVLGPNCVLM